jgi:long-chain fatty acid transport protein
MSVRSRRLSATMAAAGLLAVSASAFATNGYFMIGFGAGQVGMGGVGVTSPQDSMCVGGNPACLSEFQAPQFDMGAGLVHPERYSGSNSMTDNVLYPNGINTWSGVNTYLLPGMGFVFPFNDQLIFGFAALGNGGAGTTYKPNFFSSSPTDYLGVDMVQLIIPITVAYKLNSTQTLGVSIVPARQRFLAQGLTGANRTFNGFSSDENHLSNNGHDFANGMGVRVGWTGHYLDKKITLGATYASKVYMGKLNLYRGLFAEHGGFDIPENYALGIGVKPVENLTVALDIQRILFSGVASVGNRGPVPSTTNANLPTTCVPANPVTDTNCGGTSLGADNGAGFGWKDQTVYKLGVAYKNAFPTWFGEDKLTLRAGYNYGRTPIQQDQLLFSLLAPATSEHHYTLGATYSMGEQSIFGFGSEGLVTTAYTYSPMKRFEGPVMGLTRNTLGEAQFGMSMKILELAYTLKF